MLFFGGPCGVKEKERRQLQLSEGWEKGNKGDAKHKNKNKLHRKSFDRNGNRTGSDVRFNPRHDFRAYHNTGLPR